MFDRLKCDNRKKEQGPKYYLFEKEEHMCDQQSFSLQRKYTNLC